MEINENYNTARQKYGNEMVKRLSEVGIPSKYLLSACRFFNDGIGCDKLKNFFRQWMTYVVKNNKTIDVNKLTFEQFYQIIQKYKTAYGIPNKVYSDGQVSIGKISSAKDIGKFPVKNEWCIKQPGMFRKYINNGYSFYIIDNGDVSDYIRYVILMVDRNGNKYYWDLDNEQMDSISIDRFHSYLTQGAITFIQNLTETKQYNTVKRIRLTESVLHRIIKKCINEALHNLEAKSV